MVSFHFLNLINPFRIVIMSNSTIRTIGNTFVSSFTSLTFVNNFFRFIIEYTDIQ